MAREATAAELRQWVDDRRLRRVRTAGDWYTLAFATVMGVAATSSWLRNVDLPLAPVDGSRQALVVLVVSVGLGIVTGLGDWLVGPLGASDAEAAWLHASPVDRADLIFPQLPRILIRSLLVGLVVSGAIWLMTAPAWPWLLVPVVGSLAGTLVALGHQLGTARRHASLRPALRRLNRFDLARARRTASALQGAALVADQAMLLDVVAARTIGAPGSRLRPRGSGPRALGSADIRRLLGRAKAQLLPVLLVDLLVAALALGGQRALLLAPALLMPALALGMGGLRTVRRSSGLRRALPALGWRMPVLVAGALLVAGLNVLLLWVLMVPGLGPLVGLELALVINLVALTGALAHCSSAVPDFSTGLVMTEAGPAPVGAMFTALTGWDVALIGGVALAFGASGWTLLIPALTLLAYRIVRLSRLDRVG